MKLYGVVYIHSGICIHVDMCDVSGRKSEWEWWNIHMCMYIEYVCRISIYIYWSLVFVLYMVINDVFIVMLFLTHNDVDCCLIHRVCGCMIWYDDWLLRMHARSIVCKYANVVCCVDFVCVCMMYIGLHTHEWILVCVCVM